MVWLVLGSFSTTWSRGTLPASPSSWVQGQGARGNDALRIWIEGFIQLNSGFICFHVAICSLIFE